MITLGIIGIIAALTLPSITAKYKNRETGVRLKRFYSIMQQAVNTSKSINGDTREWETTKYNWNSSETKRLFQKYFLPYLKVSKYCGNEIGKKCAGETTDNSISYVKAVFPDGSTLSTAAVTAGFYFIYDTNGYKKPNKEGVDVFAFEINTYNNEMFNTYVWTSKIDPRNSQKREDYILACETSPENCAGLIQFDGWEIKDDYPFKY